MIAAPPSPPQNAEPSKRPARIVTSTSAAIAARRNWRWVAMISGTFTVVVALVMLVRHHHSVAEDPLNATRIQQLRAKLHQNPKDESLKTQLRSADLAERKRYFARVQRNTWGALLVGAGSALFVASALQARRGPKPFGPRAMSSPADADRQVTISRFAVYGTAAAVVGGLAVLGATRGVKLSPPAAASQKNESAAAQPTFPTAAEYLSQWPRFRGADGSGCSAATNIPVTWNLESGENIAWKTQVPLPGHNSPVVWGNRLFLTGSQGSTREIFCFDTTTGALVWRLPVTLLTPEAVAALDIPSLSGSTSATTAADDKRVFAMFATGELIAADHSGKLAWSKNFGKIDNGYGHATSLVIWRNRLILQLDQGSEEAGKSRLYSFDTATGNIVWQARRTLPSSWTTPIVASAGGREQIICIGEPWLIAYDATDGKELWKFNGFGDDLTPSPIFAAGLVFAISPNQKILALKPDGQGDVTKTHLAWSSESNVPDIASPVSNGELLFVVETSGAVTCLEASSGKKLWDHNFEVELQASPAIAGRNLYVMSTQGDAFVMDAAREFKQIGLNKFAEPIRASPAIVDGRMFVRGATNLFCIGQKTSGGTK